MTSKASIDLRWPQSFHQNWLLDKDWIFGTVWCGLFLCYSMRVEFDRFCKEFKVCGISLQVWPALIFYNGPKRSNSSCCCCNNVIMSGQCTNGLKNDSNLFHVNLSLRLSFIIWALEKVNFFQYKSGTRKIIQCFTGIVDYQLDFTTDFYQNRRPVM